MGLLFNTCRGKHVLDVVSVNYLVQALWLLALFPVCFARGEMLFLELALEQYNPEYVSVASASLYDCQQVTSLAANLTLYYWIRSCPSSLPPNEKIRNDTRIALYTFCMASQV